MRVLIACEFSGRIRDEFINLGIDAISCDILPTESPGPHFQEDIFSVLNREKFDLMIAHPSCQHLAASGAKHFEKKRKDGRQQEGIDFFMKLVNANINKICIENPIGIMSNIYRKPDQIIHPWMFGDPFEKKTCLWLKNLPKLIPTNIVTPEERHITKSGKSLPKWYNIPPSVKNRGKIRSVTFPGFAKAIASQWSNLN